MRKAGSHAHLATPGNDGVVESNAFPASENHEWFACERRPRHEAAFRKRMSRRHDNAEPFFRKRGYVAMQRNTVTLNGEWLANTTMQKALASAAPGVPT